MTPERVLPCLCLLKGSDLPDVTAPGVFTLELKPILSDKRGRRAGSDPAIIPMPSSARDQKPILPVPYKNSPGSLYSARYLSRTMVAQLALWMELVLYLK